MCIIYTKKQQYLKTTKNKKIRPFEDFGFLKTIKNHLKKPSFHPRFSYDLVKWHYQPNTNGEGSILEPSTSLRKLSNPFKTYALQYTR